MTSIRGQYHPLGDGSCPFNSPLVGIHHHPICLVCTAQGRGGHPCGGSWSVIIALSSSTLSCTKSITSSPCRRPHPSQDQAKCLMPSTNIIRMHPSGSWCRCWGWWGWRGTTRLTRPDAAACTKLHSDRRLGLRLVMSLWLSQHHWQPPTDASTRRLIQVLKVWGLLGLTWPDTANKMNKMLPEFRVAGLIFQGRLGIGHSGKSNSQTHNKKYIRRGCAWFDLLGPKNWQGVAFLPAAV